MCVCLCAYSTHCVGLQAGTSCVQVYMNVCDVCVCVCVRTHTPTGMYCVTLVRVHGKCEEVSALSSVCIKGYECF